MYNKLKVEIYTLKYTKSKDSMSTVNYFLFTCSLLMAQIKSTCTNVLYKVGPISMPVPILVLPSLVLVQSTAVHIVKGVGRINDAGCLQEVVLVYVMLTILSTMLVPVDTV